MDFKGFLLLSARFTLQAGTELQITLTTPARDKELIRKTGHKKKNW